MLYLLEEMSSSKLNMQYPSSSILDRVNIKYTEQSSSEILRFSESNYLMKWRKILVQYKDKRTKLPKNEMLKKQRHKKGKL